MAFDFEGKWATVLDGLQLVTAVSFNKEVTRSITKAHWANLYHTVYSWCTVNDDKKKEELYFKLKAYFDEVVRGQEKVCPAHNTIITQYYNYAII